MEKIYIDLNELDATLIIDEKDNGINGVIFELEEPVLGYDSVWADGNGGDVVDYYLTNFEDQNNPVMNGIHIASISREEFSEEDDEMLPILEIKIERIGK